MAVIRDLFMSVDTNSYLHNLYFFFNHQTKIFSSNIYFFVGDADILPTINSQVGVGAGLD